MKDWLTLIVLALLLIVASAALNHFVHTDIKESASAVDALEPSVNDGGKRSPVLIELFTSEGCSSCPPADEALAKLANLQLSQSADVIAISEHVDYWNRLGWADPFSSADFSARQSGYARAFGNSGVYTPQMIVDGHTEFVGSNLARALEAVERASRSPKASIRLVPTDRGENAAVQLHIEIEAIPQIAPGDYVEAFLAITEDNLQTDVARGENAGRKLGHAAVARKFDLIGRINQKDGVFKADVPIAVSNAWKREDLHAVVFVQERTSRKVVGVASTKF